MKVPLKEGSHRYGVTEYFQSSSAACAFVSHSAPASTATIRLGVRVVFTVVFFEAIDIDDSIISPMRSGLAHSSIFNRESIINASAINTISNEDIMTNPCFNPIICYRCSNDTSDIIRVSQSIDDSLCINSQARHDKYSKRPCQNHPGRTLHRGADLRLALDLAAISRCNHLGDDGGGRHLAGTSVGSGNTVE